MTHAPWKAVLQKTLESNLKKHKDAVFTQLATISAAGRPTVRTVVFRGFSGEASSDDLAPNATSDLLQFTTHIESTKVQEIMANPWCEVCWWLPETNEQFRFSGKAYIIPSSNHELCRAYPELDAHFQNFSGGFDWEKERLAVWKAMSPGMKASFTWPKPGAPRTAPDSGFTSKVEEGRSPEDQVTKSIENFALLIVAPDTLDHVELLKKPNERRVYVKNESSWVMEELNP
ncbi:hypothetical protein K493DRAFT_318901 [Basidiobolus meristosporus CBS 931.73]|uniref:Pyridoxamine 5'-phosphate oxidase Alr4036 family FMN-binding domain-containing protein n=1 Tax=Basidiobolus meristosporus CBS 931.73 TaxID=1314790 RepID=A0A1Y1XTS6_9FUNG|nr:hypothetical protein K493DRAFT_318901 [Basidiobolus meristosporus CBS 931.73]|eukprot:ORX89169.1 hypothetical protein K493DRAFT_318901 [Basidiobolus meristosporus CBS 931.73]